MVRLRTPIGHPLLARLTRCPPVAADMAKAFWQLLIPHGLQGGAVSHVRRRDDDDDVDMSDEEGWKDEYTQWWFEFLDEKNVKGISKDTWQMVSTFCHTRARGS